MMIPPWLVHWRKNVFGLPRKTTKCHSARRKLLQLEPLETRTLPSFAAPLTFNTGARPSSVVIADLNRDGRPDVITANQSDVGVLLGAANGILSPAQNISIANPVQVLVADLNLDGI